MRVTKSDIEGIVIIEPEIFSDERGYFFEAYSQRIFDEQVGPVRFVQENESKSRYGVVRGLHYQRGEAAQAKLVSVVRGRVLDIAVDIRKSSPTFGKYVAIELSEQNKRQVFIPRGFAHGFAVLSDEAVFHYRCDNYYVPTEERGIAWNDPEIGIDWGVPTESIILSAKDTENPLLREAADLFE